MSPLRVHVEAPAGSGHHADDVRRASEATLQHQAQTEGELTVLLASDERLRQLNHTFRGDDSSTDVLSFPSEAENPETGLPYLGDVAISMEAVARQAQAAGHSPREELLLLTVHGVLHLLGHDHEQPMEGARMESAQREILSQLGETAGKHRLR